MTFGDLALDSCAQFLAVAERRSVPPGTRSICHQLRRAGYQSVWSPACQDQVAGGDAGVGVVSQADAPLSLHLLPLSSRSSFGWVGFSEPLFPLGKEEWLISLWCMGIRERRRILISLNLLASFCRQSLLRFRWCVLVNLCHYW